MTRDEFEKLVEQAYDLVPTQFAAAIENVAIIVEDLPDPEVVSRLNLRSPYGLLGLYQGIPLTKRGSWYGMHPVQPDKISLYQQNIERICRTNDQVVAKVREVLIHEIGHYFGMSEEEIRSAGY